VSFEGIIGHAGPIARLKAILASGRIAGAYLFTGPDGVGKRMVAEAFARALDAEVFPIGVPKGKQQIPIEAFRGDREEHEDGLLKKLSLKTLDHHARVVIVDPADWMSDAAQDCILKSLEEPPERTLWILVAPHPDNLLETIRSRCHNVVFAPLSEAEMRKIVDPLKLDATTAEWVIALAAGSPGKAKRLAEDAEEIRGRAKELYENLTAGTLNPVIERVTRIRDTEESRRQAREVIDLAILALREELRSRELKTPPRAALLPEGLRPRLAALDSEDLADRIRDLLDHLKWIDMNANVGLAVENALLRI
jgi:DNA polymerase-3 subunit delta'